MKSTQLTVINKLGLHARASARIVQVASEYSSNIRFRHDGRDVNSKSIMSIMMLGATQGATLELVVDGKDESEALDAMTRLFADRFGEDE